MAEAIYGRTKGAVLTKLDGLGETWVLPCDTEVSVILYRSAGSESSLHTIQVNITFVFAGLLYPPWFLELASHHLILHRSQISNTSSWYEFQCTGSWCHHPWAQSMYWVFPAGILWCHFRKWDDKFRKGQLTSRLELGLIESRIWFWEWVS